MIIKVQVPVVSTEEGPVALVYNEDRSILFRKTIDAPLKVVMNGSPKKYFTADWEGTDLVLREEVGPQEW